MTRFVRRIRVVAPADVDTHTILTAELHDSLGIPEESLVGAIPVLICKETSAGIGKVADDTVSMSGNSLVINEGATGFAAGDVFTIDIHQGSEDRVASVATGTPAT